MKGYHIDHDIRWKVTGAFGIAALVVSNLASDILTSIHPNIVPPSALVIFSALFWTFDRFIWCWPGINGLIKAPVVRGDYAGSAKWSQISNALETVLHLEKTMPLLTAFPLMDKVREAITPKVDAGSVKLRIRQTWTKAAATLEVHGTVYESSSCVIAVGNEITQKVILHFSQTEQDKPSNADSIGSNLILSVDFSEAEAPKGRFFSDRGVTGTVVFDDSRR